jgi:hypothetical protein
MSEDWDIDKVIEEHRYTDEFPAFAGSHEFDLAFELFGHRVERRARVNYKYTPDWEYFDLHQGKPRKGLESWQTSLEIFTCPEEDNVFDEPETDEEDADAEPEDDDEPEDEDDGEERPAWIGLHIVETGILNRKVWDSMEEAIDAKCRIEDAERRRAAGA